MPQSTNQTDNSVRIIAGEYRSRKLEFPSLEGLRPTADRIRETLFNWLQGSIAGETCLDLFAGSGALGFEALSRGASQVDFIEQNTSAVNSIRANIKRLDAKQGNVYCSDAFAWLDRYAQDSKQYGLVFLDPPFGGEMLARAIVKLDSVNLLRDGGLVYIEKEKQSIGDDLPSNWVEVKSKKAGSVQFGLYNILRSSE
ncbi:MAG: 16S rRNA (guanine(966)-N(2))-methyltransferase RsmD [SAR86 cluster bacterium]|uniref:Ribosomal RNA small subunit methyltransferase D n=1 Tax=SAR86 cluster bacterium TaxID=2030880 RepID=A0A2A4X3E1_9GAMM|nr:MAG: 16S rRNA (guanine(966)-N(2))-methyltransferase RsmD [SAR86 cluster bacterium]